MKLPLGPRGFEQSVPLPPTPEEVEARAITAPSWEEQAMDILTESEDLCHDPDCLHRCQHTQRGVATALASAFERGRRQGREEVLADCIRRLGTLADQEREWCRAQAFREGERFAQLALSTVKKCIAQVESLRSGSGGA